MIVMKQPQMPQTMMAVCVEVRVTMTMMNTAHQNSLLINLGLKLLMMALHVLIFWTN